MIEGAFAILDVLEDAGRPLRLSQIATRAALPKQTVSRLLAQLERHGAIARTADGGITVGLRLFQLGAGWTGAALAVSAGPVLADLNVRTGAIVHLAVLEGDSLVYVAKLAGRDGSRAPSRVGGSQPALASAVGKALVAGLAPGRRDRLLATVHAERFQRLNAEITDVSRTGVAFDRQELAKGLACVAAPIITPAGSTIAGLSLAVCSDRPLHKLAGEVRKAASAVGGLMSR